MPISFYPYEEDLRKEVNMPVEEKIEILLEAAERYKGVVLDVSQVAVTNSKSGTVPADVKVSYNWDGLAQVLREVRQMNEATPNDKRMKGERLLKLAEVYEVLRAAKMQK